MFLRHAIQLRGTHILDFGCGTGKAGIYLRSREPTVTITGVDVSSGMLEHAAAKGCYDQLLHIASSEDLRRCQSVDGIICSGVFTHAHIGAEEIHNLLAVLKVGGVLSISARESYCAETGMAEIVRDLASGDFEQLEAVRHAPYQELLSSKDAEGAYWVLRRKS